MFELIIIFVIVPLSFLAVSLINNIAFMLKKDSDFKEERVRLSIGDGYKAKVYHEVYFNPKNLMMYSVVEVKYKGSVYFEKEYVIVGRKLLGWINSYSLRSYDYNKKMLGEDENKALYLELKKALENKDYDLVKKLSA